MKKWIAALLAVMMLTFCACASENSTAADTPETATASDSDTNTPKAPPSASDTEPTQQTAQTQTEQNTKTREEKDPMELDEEAYQKAKTYIKNSVDELILAIGQPISKEETEESTVSEPKYELTYPGFYVYTTRTTSGEMIDDVALMG